MSRQNFWFLFVDLIFSSILFIFPEIFHFYYVTINGERNEEKTIHQKMNINFI